MGHFRKYVSYYPLISLYMCVVYIFIRLYLVNGGFTTIVDLSTNFIQYDDPHHRFTVTSILFNNNNNNNNNNYGKNNLPSWYHTILGEKSIFFSKSTIHSKNNISQTELHSIEEKARLKLRNLPPIVGLKDQSCFFEVLGFVELGQAKPFFIHYKHLTPIVGLARLSIDYKSNPRIIECYYRTLYENWRQEFGRETPYHWATVFYCPTNNQTICDDISNSNTNTSTSTSASTIKSIYLSLKFKLFRHVWQYKFRANIIPNRGNSNQNVNQSIDRKVPTLGVCLPIPFQSSREEKTIVNKVLLSNWIMYYKKLGIMMMIYDRDGFHSDYLHQQPKLLGDDVSSIVPNKEWNRNDDRRNSNYPNLVNYYNFTIRGLLAPNTKGFKYDNEDGFDPTIPKDQRDASLRSMEGLDNDKVLTLTHCRFEMKALFGIENVIVVDFDEFFYCPISYTRSKSMMFNIEQLIHRKKQQGYDQLLFSQRILSNITTSLLDCLIEKTKRNSSVLQCYAPYRYTTGAHSYKSIQLGHKCPLTGYHESCPTSDHPRGYDCQCKSSVILSECSFVHFTSTYKNFVRYFDERYRKRISAVPNEIYRMIIME